MIGVLGIQRVAILGALVFLNVALALLVYMYLAPEKVNKERELRAVRSQVSTLSGDIDRMQLEFDQLETQQDRFEDLEDDGFFRNQSRRQAELVFNDIQTKSGVIKAIANISAGVIEDNAEAAKAKYKILKSPMSVRLEAMNDLDVYHYIFLVENYFPGHVAVDNIRLERDADVTGTVLRGIASGANPPLVKAEVEMVWRTMIPESQIIEIDQGQP